MFSWDSEFEWYFIDKVANHVLIIATKFNDEDPSVQRESSLPKSPMKKLGYQKLSIAEFVM